MTANLTSAPLAVAGRVVAFSREIASQIESSALRQVDQVITTSKSPQGPAAMSGSKYTLGDIYMELFDALRPKDVIQRYDGLTCTELRVWT